ncbi:tyrosine-type recombinase/integrase [Photobacterium angustum]|uniref:tyrosine-type recombinase/integrase n=1 Tax=Photobacterium angustum TaxID=661 RepID=UPI0005E74D1A|nr:site-specific integrase [Photobacterium angustum]KJG00067.1 integrase [Photobacterium angustum]PSV64995.1 site-specific integrase [Photobacterium angustum]
MASMSITKRKNKHSNATKYCCRIRHKANNGQSLDYSRTFEQRQLATKWGQTEINKLNGIKHGGIIPQQETVGYLIQQSLERGLVTPEQRSKHSNLNMLLRYPIAMLPLADLQEYDIVEHCQLRRKEGALPQTINVEISNLRALFKLAKPVFRLAINDQIFRDVYGTLVYMKLVAKSNRRNRRPTSEELKRLEHALRQQQNKLRTTIPYADLLEFSILSCMRVSEMCSILWSDIDDKTKSVLVRDRKDPREKIGNHQMVPLLGSAWDIVQAQPQTDSRIFPYNPKSVSTGFQRVRNKLGIKDLRYHDMRREGASRLFETGFSIEEVAQVTGHKDLKVLWQVYTELNPGRLHARISSRQKS